MTGKKILSGFFCILFFGGMLMCGSEYDNGIIESFYFQKILGLIVMVVGALGWSKVALSKDPSF